MILYSDDHTHGLTIRNNIFAGSQNFLHSFKGTGNALDNNIFYSKNDASAYPGPQIFNMLNWQHYPAEQGQAFAKLTHNLYVVDRGVSSAVPVLYFPVKSTGSTVTPDVVTSDNNLYFQVGATISNFASNATLDNWKAEFGQDAHSLFNVDPLFVNPAAGDFRLQPGSPALGIGFVPFDLSAAGRK